MDIFVYDTSFSCIGILDDYTSLIWTERYNECGDFELELVPSVNILNMLKEDYYLMLKDSEYTMVIETLEITYDSDNGDTLRITGRSLESVLDRRIVWGQTNLDGSVQEGVKKLLNDAAINPSNVNRKIPNLVFAASTDTDVTKYNDLEAQFTGESLYQAICTICQAYNLGFKLIVAEDSSLIFSLYAGKNRSYDQMENPYVIFSSQFDDIVSSDYMQSKRNFKNVTLVAGEGEGTAMKVLEVSRNDETYTGLARREVYTDANDISSTSTGGTVNLATYNSLLKERGVEALAEASTTVTFDGQTDPRGLFVYGIDFKMGDLVQIANDYGWESKLRITEFIRSQDNNGYTEYPTFSQVDENVHVAG